ncbi:MAG: hypothetical protein CBB68_02435 [Rhodospirillaceae bacterium TMED8]|nr:hypothetical protein [Magnetovibrio sp.]OUT52233.1 MAG: hypothetical protein CBB68_02435 [Rhodospirillaceae bacterium TMED8]
MCVVETFKNKDMGDSHKPLYFNRACVKQTMDNLPPSLDQDILNAQLPIGACSIRAKKHEP